MSNSSLEISNALDPLVFEALKDISKQLKKLSVPFFLIGAVARDIIAAKYGQYSSRRTTDLDLAILLSNEEAFIVVQETLIASKKYTKDPKQEQRLNFESGTKIDLLPFGAIAEGEKIRLPPSYSFVINVGGFQEAYDASEFINLGQGTQIRIVTVEDLVVLKIVAWNDRPNERERDVVDVTFIFNEYLRFAPGSDEEIFINRSDLLLVNSGDVDIAAVELLGFRISERVKSATLDVLKNTFGTESRRDKFVSAMVPASPIDSRKVDRSRRQLTAFCRGLDS